DGSADPVSSGTLVFADGRTQPLTAQDLTVESLDYWTSPRSKAQYPQQWRITAPSLGLNLDVRSLLADQELNTARSTRVVYWEGAVSATGQAHGTAVTGRGYVELTGYAERFTQRL
ncbi:MAG: lipocalin family protein, partial [Nitrospira sp.]